MSYGYDPKLLKEYENLLPRINQKTIEYQVNVFENKCAYVFVTASVTDIFPTDNSVTASVPTGFLVKNLYQLQTPSLSLSQLIIPSHNLFPMRIT